MNSNNVKGGTTLVEARSAPEDYSIPVDPELSVLRLLS
jgi:hypothetical protein